MPWWLRLWLGLGVASLAVGLVFVIDAFLGEGPRRGVLGAIFAAIGVGLLMPAGYAVAMWSVGPGRQPPS